MSSNEPIGSDPAPKPTRRTFTSEYKLRIVAEYDAAPRNEKGAVLRRERLFHSHVKEWRAARDAGALEKLVDRRTGPARAKKSAAEVENEKLRQQVERLEMDLARNKAALEVMGKASALLEMISESAG
jgi:transposase-like protein